MTRGPTFADPIRGYFVTGTGTSVGKTVFTRALARLASRYGSTAAIKPMETGCNSEPLDALALARAAGRSSPPLAPDPFYRHALPVAPYAAHLADGSAPPSIDRLARRCREMGQEVSSLIVEGAGGIRVPINADEDMSDFARALGLPVILLARDALGVLSHVLTCVDSAASAELTIAAIVLTRRGELDASARHNRQILAARLASIPVEVFDLPASELDDHLADALGATALGERLLAPLVAGRAGAARS